MPGDNTAAEALTDAPSVAAQEHDWNAGTIQLTESRQCPAGVGHHTSPSDLTAPAQNSVLEHGGATASVSVSVAMVWCQRKV